MHKAKVIISQESGRLNFADAERFGEIRFLTNQEYSKIKSSITNKQTLKDVKDGLSDFDPDKDFLLLSGDPILMAFSFHLAFSKAKYVKLLKWDKVAGQYFEIHFHGQ